jgi:Restriction endonuclease
MVDKLISAIKLRLTPTSPPRPVAVVLTEILHEEHSELTAFEMGGTLAPRVFAGLQRVRENAESDNADTWFAFNSSSSDHIQGPYFIEPCDSPEIRQAKLNRLNRYPLRPIVEGLTPYLFEALCVGLLSLLGARDYSGTKRTRDQGIDFFGRLVISDLDANTSPFFRITDHLSVWLVGQAKNYPNGKVSSAEIRDLVGSINLARFKEYASTTDLMKSLPLRSCDRCSRCS